MQLIIPALNEERRLPSTLRALRAYRARAPATALGPVEVIVVDNASTDATAEVARGLRLRRHARARHPLRDPGQGRSRARGSAGDARTTSSGSWTPTAPPHLDALLDAQRAHRRRCRPRGRVPGGGRLGHLRATQQGARRRRRGLPLPDPQGRHGDRSDTQCGFKLMRGDLARRDLRDHPLPTGFSFDVEVIGRFQRARGQGRGVPRRVDRRARLDVPAGAPRSRRRSHRSRRSLCACAGIVPSAVGDAQCGHPGARAGASRGRCSASDRSLQGARVAVLNWRDPWHSLAGGSERYAWELRHRTA